MLHVPRVAGCDRTNSRYDRGAGCDVDEKARGGRGGEGLRMTFDNRYGISDGTE